MLRPKLRRWVMYEWFCSPVDYGWYADNEFTRVLQECGLGHVTQLMRREWGALRSLFGRGRRFSEAFLRQERGKLYAYRSQVRSLSLRELTLTLTLTRTPTLTLTLTLTFTRCDRCGGCRRPTRTLLCLSRAT